MIFIKNYTIIINNNQVLTYKTLINLDDIKGHSALSLLENYDGINPYLRKLKNEYLKNKKLALTDNQSKYIFENYERQPQLINRIVNITSYLGEELKRQEELSFVPERVLIEFILAETDKSFHIYGKLKKNQIESKMYWLPKTQVTDDPYFEPIIVDVNFDKYNNILKKDGKKLYKHQEEGIKFLLSRNGCILADDMGLGKSVQSIIAALESGAEKILVIAPSSAKINWEREINTFCDDTTIIDGKKWDSAKFTIINYDILKNFHTLVDPRQKMTPEELSLVNRQLVESKFDLVIIDEAHYLKNHESIRGKIMVELTVKYGINKVWLLTGTPVANRPMDFFNLLKIIKSPIADNWKHYAVRYCDGKKFFRTLKNGQKKQIWITDGASNLDELAAKTKNIILRRLKTDVIDMPDKVIIPTYHKLSTKGWKQYDLLWDEYLQKRLLEGKRNGSLQRDLVELILLRQFIAAEAIPHTIEMVENAIEQGRKVIIFTSFTEELEILAAHFGKIAVKHNGPMSTTQKQKSVDSFQKNSKVKVFIGNIKSAGVAITLTEATVVVFNSFSWVPGDNEQAEDRCIFSGQLIMTKEGYKKIEDIKNGDLVYTHLGNFKPVTGVHTHLERKKLRVDINGFGYNKDLSVTEDHEIFVYNSETKTFEWVNAINLDIKKHYLTLKSNKQPIKRKEFLDITHYINENFENNFLVTQKNGRLVKLKNKVELTNELLYAFGFFIAEGWATTDENKGSSVNVCQKIDNKKMYDAAKYIIDIFKTSFEIENHSEYIDKNNIKTCTIYSKNLAINFNEWFGKGVKNKHMPIWVDELNHEQLQSLFDGFNHGDGYKRNNTQQNITASSKLGSELVRYSANLEHNVSFSVKNTNGLEYYQTEYSFNDNKKLNRILKEDGYIIYPIKSLHISKPQRGEERVYDLSVEDDHSFVVGNYNVHNCYRIGQKNDVNVYYQLFDDTISIRMWNMLNNKKDVISTIIGDKKMSEEELIAIMTERLMDEL